MARIDFAKPTGACPGWLIRISDGRAYYFEEGSYSVIENDFGSWIELSGFKLLEVFFMATPKGVAVKFAPFEPGRIMIVNFSHIISFDILPENADIYQSMKGFWTKIISPTSKIVKEVVSEKDKEFVGSKEEEEKQEWEK